MYKHSSLFFLNISDKEKDFNNSNIEGQCLKTFYNSNLLICLVSWSVCPRQPFTTSLIFAVKGRSLRKNAAPWVGYCLTPKH